MGIFKELLKSFLEQGSVGWIVILIIILVGGYNIFLNIKMKRFYRELLDELKESNSINSAGEKEFLSGPLLEIAEDFKRGAKRGIDNINTEVLIIKHLKESNDVNERLLTVLPASCIALGLLGTFLGLTISIHGTNGVLESGVKTMEVFLSKMSVPLQGMSSAFWTSIFGVIMSLILNNLNAKVKKTKEEFFDEMEDYLDNTLYGEYSYSFVTQFEKFNDIVSKSMLRLAVDMRELFMNGVNELVSNINKNTLDMTNTAKELTVYTEDFGKVIGRLGETIESFNDPIERFKGSINEFTLTTDKLEFIMNKSIEKLEDKLDYLSGVIGKLNTTTTDRNNIFEDVILEVKEGRDKLQNTYSGIVTVMEEINKSILTRDENLAEEIKGLNSGYEKFEEITEEFKVNIEGLREKIELGVQSSVQKGFTKISYDLVNELKGALEDIDEAINTLSMNTQTVGRLVKATNDWVDIRKE